VSRVSRSVGLAVVLGLLSAVGPFAIDMYLPAMPAIGTELGTDIGRVQLTLTVFFVAMGVGQLLYGPLSDMFGRKPPLYVGLGLFAVASVGCAVTTDVDLLIALRFVQGLGAAASTAIPRAVVRDLHTGSEAARLMSMLMLVFSVSPILAPLVGSGLIAVGGWRSVFWAVTLAAVAAAALVATRLPETRPPSRRVQSSLGSALRGYGRLVADFRFLGLVLVGAFAMTGFFVFLSTSSFVMIDHYGLTPTQFSIAFGVNAIAFFAAAQLNGRLSRRFGLAALVRAGAIGSATILTILVGYFALGGDQLAVLIALNCVSSASMGFVVPTSSVLALDGHGPIAGTASALMGTLQMVIGAIGMATIGLFSDGRPLPMVIGMAIGVYLSLTMVALTLGTGSRRSAQAR
jgi:DHA1 family bicyclomycin/chloramphenicol resistance-like MFS transporter